MDLLIRVELTKAKNRKIPLAIYYALFPCLKSILRYVFGKIICF